MQKEIKYPKRLTTRCGYILHAQVEQLAKTYNVKKGVMIRILITKAIKDYEKQFGDLDLAR